MCKINQGSVNEMTFQPKFYRNKYGDLAMTYEDFDSLTKAQKIEMDSNFWRFGDYVEGGYYFKEMTDSEKAMFA